jgi:arylsulfatase A-like enzyme
VGSISRFNWQSRPLRPVDNVEDLATEKVTVAEALQKAGYRTGMFGKWHLGNGQAHHPLQQGFDEAIVSAGKHFDFNTNPRTDYPRGAYLADWLTDRSLDFIRRHKDRPFFLYLPHFGVHSPFQAKPELIQRFEKKAAAGGHHNPTYAAMIYSVDESVGRVVALLDELKLSDNTLVIFSSDNGGVGGYVREGLAKAGGITDNTPLRGGKGMLYEGGVRVPYLFRWPGKIAAGKVCDEPINSVDLYPTFVELAGAKTDPNQPLDGQSYLGLLTGAKSDLGGRALYWHFPGYLGAGTDSWRTTPAGAVQVGAWKLLEFFETGKRELYNLDDDLGQQKDLAKTMPEKADELHMKLVSWRAAIKAPMPSKNAAGKP